MGKIHGSAFVSYLLLDVAMESAFRSMQLYVTWWFLQSHDMTVGLSVTLAVVSFFNVIFIPISGTWSNKVPLSNYIARAVHLGCLALVSFVIALRLLEDTRYWLWVLIILMVLLGIATALLRPLSMKVINGIFQGEAAISKAYKTKYALAILNILLGPTLSGLMIETYGGKAPLVCAFIFYGLALLGAAVFKNASRGYSDAFSVCKTTRGAWVTELIHGFRLNFYIKEERAIAIMSALLNCFFSPFMFLLLPAVIVKIHAYTLREVGLIELCFGVGIAISCTDYATSFFKNKVSLYHACVLYIVMLTGAFALFSTLSNILLLCFTGAIMGAALNSLNVVINTRRLHCIPSSHQAMMEGCFVFLCTAAVPVGLLLTGALMRILPSQTVIGVYASICFSSVLFFCASVSVKRMLQPNVQADYYAKQYPKLFNCL
jgi:MFS transporter, DHA3 family, macrolide efflux protein